MPYKNKRSSALCNVSVLCSVHIFPSAFCKKCENAFTKKQKIQLGCIYLVPAAALFLWKNYIDKAYLEEGYDTVKFAITKENLLKNYYEKSPELVGRIISDVSGTDAIYKYLKNTDFIVQILPHENFVPLMEEMGITVDNPDAIMYEIIKDENGTPLSLVQRQ